MARGAHPQGYRVGATVSQGIFLRIPEATRASSAPRFSATARSAAMMPNALRVFGAVLSRGRQTADLGARAPRWLRRRTGSSARRASSYGVAGCLQDLTTPRSTRTADRSPPRSTVATRWRLWCDDPNL